jgi:toxin ParE1/3/4
MTATAERDFNAIVSYLDTHAVQGTAVAELVESLISAFELLAQSPTIGAARPNIGRDVRCWSVPPYVVFYRGTGDGVVINRILHQRRNAQGPRHR